MSTTRVSDKSRHAFVRGGDRLCSFRDKVQGGHENIVARTGTDSCQATRKSLSRTEASNLDMIGIIAGRCSTILHTVPTIKQQARVATSTLSMRRRERTGSITGAGESTIC